MDEAYRDRAAAALARAESLEQEVHDLRAANLALQEELLALREKSKRVPAVRHSGALVVAGVVMVMGSLLGAALFMQFQLRSEPSVVTTVQPSHAATTK